MIGIDGGIREHPPALWSAQTAVWMSIMIAIARDCYASVSPLIKVFMYFIPLLATPSS